MKLKDASVPNGSEVNLFSSATSGRCGRPQHESRWHTSVATAVPSQVAESKRSSDQSEWRKFASGEILGNPIGGRMHGSTARSTGADYLGLAKDHQLRSGTDTCAAWDSHLALLHPDDQDETRRVWSECLTTSSAAERHREFPDRSSSSAGGIADQRGLAA